MQIIVVHTHAHALDSCLLAVQVSATQATYVPQAACVSCSLVVLEIHAVILARVVFPGAPIRTFLLSPFIVNMGWVLHLGVTAKMYFASP